MKLTSKHISALAGFSIILVILVIKPFLKKMEVSQNISMAIYFTIAAFLIYLIYLRIKLEEDKKQSYTILAIVLITLFIIIAIYFYFFNIDNL
ncbi:MAG: hypothetical protein IPH57_05060 [Saprospiraceae bacterium]|nr:hypothetical protein [Saprospiraceae bacterium]